MGYIEELFSLKGKVVVVLGGTSGIGRAIAVGFAQAGANVVASSRRSKLVSETAEELKAIGGKTIALTCDVCDQQSLSVLCEKVVEELGSVDVLVVSSGVLFRSDSIEMPENELVRIIDTNLNGTFRANQVIGRQMIQQGKGSIVNISSIAGYRSILGLAPYSASKAAVSSLTATLACEWAPSGVRVNGIAPGPFKTEINVELMKIPGRMKRVLGLIPMKRFGNLGEMVGVSLFLGSDASSYVTGVTIPVDGGFLTTGI